MGQKCWDFQAFLRAPIILFSRVASSLMMLMDSWDSGTRVKWERIITPMVDRFNIYQELDTSPTGESSIPLNALLSNVFLMSL
jgi:hypothetical protein